MTHNIEAVEDATPLLFPVLTAPGPGLNRLWLGNLPAAQDAHALARADITTSLNLAMNIAPTPLTLMDGTTVRRYQVGLLDGAGNSAQMLMAAVMVVDGLVACYTHGKSHYPAHRPGGLLVHCRGGRSRSVTVLGLWLCWRGHFGSLDAALNHLRNIRGMDQTYPLPPMIDLAQKVLSHGMLPR